MNRRLAVAGLASVVATLLCLTSTVLAESEEPSPEPAAVSTDDDRLVLLFLDRTRPVFIHLHVEVDGKGFRSAWEEYVAKLFDQLDADGDGQLNAKEVQQGPWTQLVAGQFDEYAAKTLTFAWDVQPADGTISRAELAAGLQAIDAALDVRPMPPTTSGVAAGNRLLAVLDGNGDKQLSQPEVAQARTRLRKLDLDDDGTVSIEELRPFQNPFFRQRRLIPANNREGSSQSASNPFFLLAGRRSIRPLIRALLSRYDTSAGARTGVKGNNRLSRDEIELKPPVFDRFDANADGELSTREVRALLGDPPVDVDLAVRIGDGEAGGPRISLLSDTADSGSGSGEFRLSGDASPTLTLKNVQIEFAVDAPPNDAQQSRRILSQFQSADGDNNDYLDAQEAAQVGFGRFFQAMDRDNDEKIFQEEVTDFLAHQSEAARSRTVLTLRDNGSELFELTDTSGDSRLSQRELGSMQNRLSVWDADGDGELAVDEAIHNYRVALGRGSVNLTGSPVARNQASRGSRVPGGQGPLWFQKMDRNRDGDVSEREFFGPGEAFRQLDADSDGLIDPREAASADR